jgi:anthranilate phosphoribosyltransferase
MIARRILAGEPGPVRDIVRLNAAAAIVAAAGTPVPDRLTPALRLAYERTAEALDSGAAIALLDRWITLTRALKS